MADGPGLDDLDRRIVYALQADARHTSSSEIADRAGVSASTVRKRITRLEERGIIRDYHVDIDYERAGFQLYTLIVCTAPIPKRERLAREAAEVSGVVNVQEVMTGTENVLLSVVGRDGDDLSRIGRELDELGFEVADEDIIRNEHRHPYHGFAPDVETDANADADADTGERGALPSEEEEGESA